MKESGPQRQNDQTPGAGFRKHLLYTRFVGHMHFMPSRLAVSSSGVLWIPHLLFLSNYFSRFILELDPFLSSYFYLRKQNSVSQKIFFASFQIQFTRLVLTQNSTIYNASQYLKERIIQFALLFYRKLLILELVL